MSKDNSVALDDQSIGFVDRQVADGRYRSASEVVRAGLRLLEEREQRSALQQALIEGEKSGPSVPFDFSTFLDRKRQQPPG